MKMDKLAGFAQAAPMKTLLALLLLTAAPVLAQPVAAPEAPQTRLRKPDVAFEPTPHDKVRQMLALAGVKAGDVVYDLGSGDGRIPIAAVREFGAARGVGLDLNPKLVERARGNAQAAGVADKVSFRYADIFTADLSDATVVTLFLWPSVNDRLQPKLKKELKPGTRVVSYWHDMTGWQPDRVISGGLIGGKIYLWTIPERAP